MTAAPAPVHTTTRQPEAPKLGKPDYGLDAPGMQKASLYGGLAGVVIGRMAYDYGVMHSTNWALRVGSIAMSMGFSFFVVGCISYVGSKFGKLLLRDRMLNSIAWRGDEQVLDVGCGHGLLLIGAAKRLKQGRAIGVDVWSQVDQAKNSAEATKRNACIEGVADRIEIQDADARKLPFADNSFDVVLSSFVIHNISGSSERETAIREIARVLKPGGRVAIADIRHAKAYRNVLRELGWEDTQLSGPNFFIFVTPTRVLHAFKPNGNG
jgi:arsenite methyltransferase